MRIDGKNKFSIYIWDILFIGNYLLVIINI
jgi:hypothetical protein